MNSPKPLEHQMSLTVNERAKLTLVSGPITSSDYVRRGFALGDSSELTYMTTAVF